MNRRAWERQRWMSRNASGVAESQRLQHRRGIVMEPNLQKIEALVRQLLTELGEDPSREGLLKTPERVAKALAFLTHGYRTNLGAVINNALFTQTTSSMVIVKDIEV